jgi:hypothetical protein
VLEDIGIQTFSNLNSAVMVVAMILPQQLGVKGSMCTVKVNITHGYNKGNTGGGDEEIIVFYRIVIEEQEGQG